MLTIMKRSLLEADLCPQLKVKHFQKSDLTKEKMCNMQNQFKFRFQPVGDLSLNVSQFATNIALG